jgi:hypothetical protein
LARFAQSDAGALVTLSVSNSIVSNNGAGIATFGARPGRGRAATRSSDNASVGLLNSAGLFETAGNNAVRNNAPNKSGAITAIVQE